MATWFSINVESTPNAFTSFDVFSTSILFSFSVKLCSLFAEEIEVMTNLCVLIVLSN